MKLTLFVFSLQSLKSCGYVKEQFAWRHFYWYLTNEGIQYLRDFLHLPPEIVPATLRRQTRPETARPRPKGKLPGTMLLDFVLTLFSKLDCGKLGRDHYLCCFCEASIGKYYYKLYLVFKVYHINCTLPLHFGS